MVKPNWLIRGITAFHKQPEIFTDKLKSLIAGLERQCAGDGNLGDLKNNPALEVTARNRQRSSFPVQMIKTVVACG